MAVRPLSLKARALQWLAQREHSEVELRRKLLRVARQRAAAQTNDEGSDTQAAAATEVGALLEWLLAHRFLSDARFVESRINARAARYGNLRIRQELGQHGAALDAASAERLKDSELARARAVWARKYGSPACACEPARTVVERARQMRFLASRGFSADVIRRVVRGGETDLDEHG